MSVWEALNSFFGRSPLKEAAEQFASLAREYKEDIKHLKEHQVGQDKLIREQDQRIHELEAHNADCNRDNVRYLKEIRDLKEQLIFLTRGKNKGKGEDYPSY